MEKICCSHLNSSISSIWDNTTISGPAALKTGVSIRKYGRLINITIDQVGISDGTYVIDSKYAPGYNIISMGANQTNSEVIRCVLTPSGDIKLRLVSGSTPSGEKSICTSFVYFHK